MASRRTLAYRAFMRPAVILFLILFLFFITSVGHAAPNVAYAINIPSTDGFDYPVAKPHAIGYYKSRGWFRYHPGEDWVAVDRSRILGAPVYSIGTGIIVFTRNAPGGWGNVVIVRHAYYDKGILFVIDSFYAHLRRVVVQEGQLVNKGQQVGEVGTNRGMYRPHLHLEIRKNLLIGIDRAGYARTFNNYWVPTQFIEAHRKVKHAGRRVSIPTETFEFHAQFPFPIDESKGYQKRKSTRRTKNAEQLNISPNRKPFRVKRFESLQDF